MYRLERFLTSRWFVRQVYSRLFRLKADQCTACGLWMRVCPTRNVREDGAGRPVWGRDCLLCLYCEMKCPEEAIISPASCLMFRPFMVYMFVKPLGTPRWTM